MKRGFFLRAEQKKAAAKRRGLQNQCQPSVQPLSDAKGLEVKKKFRILGKLAYGNLTEEEKALPSDYDRDNRNFKYENLDWRRTDLSEDMTAVTSIPQPVPLGETQCEWIVHGPTKAKVLNAPGYPSRVPKPRRPDLYQVKSTPEMGEALFAKRDIKRGDVFLAERPLLVTSYAISPTSKDPIPDHYTTQQVNQVVMFEFESLLEVTIARLPSESQADFRALHNAHTNDGSGPLLGVIRTNSYVIENLYDDSHKAGRYGAICKIGSRINHSCMPNVRYYFKLNSFSMQFYAIRDIKAGEQLFSSYCLPDRSLTQRQADLAPYGFVCKCPACLNATAETDKLRDTFENRIDHFENLVENSSKITKAVLKNAVKLEKDMVKEGLDGEPQYVTLLRAICLAYAKAGKLEESEKYGVLMETFQDCFKEDE